MFQIKGKVALLIGAGRGVGVELARQLLLNQIKAIVIAEPNTDLGRMVVQKLREEFGEMRVVHLQVDITNPQELEGLFLSTIKLFENLDIVINNVGVLDENEIDRSLNVSMLTAIRSTKLAVNVFLPKSKTGTEGVVINVNAVVALGGNLPGVNLGLPTLTGLTAGTQYERNNVKVISLYIGTTPSDVMTGLVANQLVQNINNISDLRIQPGLESAGKALINAIEQGVSGSSFVGMRQPTESLLQGNWNWGQLRL